MVKNAPPRRKKCKSFVWTKTKIKQRSLRLRPLLTPNSEGHGGSNSSNSVQQPSTGDSPECCTKWAKQIRGKIILNASSAAEFESVLLNVNFFFFF